MISTEKLKQLREEKKLSQEEMAELTGLSKNGYRNIECGESHPKAESLYKIAQILGVKIDDLIEHNHVIYAPTTYDKTNNGNYNDSTNYYGDAVLMEKLKNLEEQLTLKDALLSEKDKRINDLEEIVKLLKE